MLAAIERQCESQYKYLERLLAKDPGKVQGILNQSRVDILEAVIRGSMSDDIVKQLIALSDSKEKGKLLMAACEAGKGNIVDCLLWDPEVRRHAGYGALYCAVKANALSAVQSLLFSCGQASFWETQYNSFGECMGNILHVAAQYADRILIEQLLTFLFRLDKDGKELAAMLNQKDPYHNTVLDILSRRLCIDSSFAPEHASIALALKSYGATSRWDKAPVADEAKDDVLDGIVVEHPELKKLCQQVVDILQKGMRCTGSLFSSKPRLSVESRLQLAVMCDKVMALRPQVKNIPYYSATEREQAMNNLVLQVNNILSEASSTLTGDMVGKLNRIGFLKAEGPRGLPALVWKLPTEEKMDGLAPSI